MNRFLRAATVLPLWVVASLPAPAAGQATSQAKTVPSIRRVQVLHTRGQVEIEIEASDRVVPQTNLLSGPDRLVVDFVNAVPGEQLRNLAVNREEVKNLRVGLFASNPPVTRIVLDLNGPQPYQVFPSGRTVILKIGDGGETAGARVNLGAALVNSNYSAMGAHLSVATPPPPRPALDVTFRNGLLFISSNKANLSEVLFAIHERTGAEIAIPAGAEQEQVVGDIGPAPAPVVLSQLLNGSKFNFVIVNSPTNPLILDSVILSSRPEGPMPQPKPQPPPRVVAEDDEDASETPVIKPAGSVPPPPQAANEKAKQPNDPQAPGQDAPKAAGESDPE